MSTTSSWPVSRFLAPSIGYPSGIGPTDRSPPPRSPRRCPSISFAASTAVKAPAKTPHRSGAAARTTRTNSTGCGNMERLAMKRNRSLGPKCCQPARRAQDRGRPSLPPRSRHPAGRWAQAPQARRHAARQQWRRSARLRRPPVRDLSDAVRRRALLLDAAARSIPTDSNRLLPDLAEKWEVSPDGKTVTFHLRGGVAFHNGTPLTAEDVVYSLDRIRKPPRGIVSPRKGLLGNVTGDRGAQCRARWSYASERSRSPISRSWSAIPYNVIVQKTGGRAAGCPRAGHEAPDRRHRPVPPDPGDRRPDL